MVARFHHASLDAFSTGAKRSSKRAIKPSTSAGEFVTKRYRIA
jgi:hypothetical protein